MATEVIMPKLGLTMTEGTVINWLKKEGDIVKVGEPLFSVETDKVAIDVETTISGTLLKILVPVGATVPILEVVGFIGQPGEPIPEIKRTAAPMGKPQPVPDSTDSFTHRTLPVKAGGDIPILISPIARRLAKEHHIDLGDIKGSGPQGRIVEEDVQKLIDAAGKDSGNETPYPALTVPSELQPLNQIKRITAKRMSESFQQAPHFYLTKEIDCNQLVALREKLLPEYESKYHLHLTYTDFILKALAVALPLNPLLNASWENGQVRIYQEVHLGVAISTPQGLVVGVIHGTEKMSLPEIATIRDALAGRARDGHLTTEDISNGTITVTNLGMFGVDTFLPIINPPQSAIVAIGSINDRPVAENGRLVIHPTMTITVAMDHRVVDGVEGATFLKTLAELIAQKAASLAD